MPVPRGGRVSGVRGLEQHADQVLVSNITRRLWSVECKAYLATILAFLSLPP